MKRIAVMVMCAAAVALSLSGCDWDTGSDAENWSSSYNWVNFGGTYRSAAGGVLVTDYTTTPSTPGSTNTVVVSSESQGDFAAYQTSFSGTLRNGSIVPGSVVVTLQNFAGIEILSLSDNGNGVLETSSGSGTISYSSGKWTVSLSSASPIVEAGRVRAGYSYYVSNSGSAGSGARPGSTGKTIYSFVVDHQGQHLTFTDNNGAIYTGRFGDIRSASGAQNTDITQVGSDEEGNDGSRSAKYTYYESPLPEDGDTIVASFECSGHSAVGMWVKIVGTFQGTVAAGVFTGRTLNGTWLEAGGKAGDIRGQTTTIPIVTGGTEGEGEGEGSV